MSGAASRRPSRREVLVGGGLIGGGLLALAGCLPGVDDASPPPVDPELRVRARIAEEVRALARHYEAVSDRFPAARPDGLLAAFAAEHTEHARALLGPGARSRSRTTSATSSPSAGATVAPPVPTDEGEALRSLVVAERAASRRRARQAGRASPALARLLASIAACEAAHAALLERDSS